MSNFAPMSVIVFVNFLISVENKPVVDCFVNKIFLSLDNPFACNKENETQPLILESRLLYEFCYNQSKAGAMAVRLLNNL